MLGDDLEKKTMEDLSKFLKNFKTIVTTKLRIIQSFLAMQQDSQSSKSQESMITKITQQSAIQHDEYLNNTTVVDGTIEKLFYRFCLRINEFLQYRLCDLRSHQESYVRQQVSTLQRSLNGIFKQTTDRPTLNMLIKQILTVEHNFSIRLLSKISTHVGVKYYFDKQNFHSIVKLLKEKFPSITPNNKTQFSPYRFQGYQSSLTQHNEYTSVYSKSSKKVRTNKLKSERPIPITSFDGGWDGILPSILSTKDKIDSPGRISSVQNTDQSSFRHNRRHTFDHQYIYASNSLNHIRLNGDSDMNPQNMQSFTKKEKYLKALGVMELQQHPYGSYSTEYLMAQLVTLNKKNQTIVDKFRKRYERKKAKSQKNLQTKERTSEKLEQNQSSVIRKNVLIGMKKLPFVPKRNSAVRE